MKKDTYTTDVVFRVDTTKDFKGTVFALMPHECCDRKGHVPTYQHIGQHSAADYRFCIAQSRPAKPSEFKELLNEMEVGHGYNLKIVLKQNYAKWLKSYHEANK